MTRIYPIQTRLPYLGLVVSAGVTVLGSLFLPPIIKEDRKGGIAS
ncbi:MAG: hypothetical protein ACTSYI_07845 [Promethearchaeota archaeon]